MEVAVGAVSVATSLREEGGVAPGDDAGVAGGSAGKSGRLRGLDDRRRSFEILAAKEETAAAAAAVAKGPGSDFVVFRGTFVTEERLQDDFRNTICLLLSGRVERRRVVLSMIRKRSDESYDVRRSSICHWSLICSYVISHVVSLRFRLAVDIVKSSVSV